MSPQQKLLSTVTNQTMASTQVKRTQDVVDDSTIIVKEHLDSVKKIVARVLGVMRVWKNKYKADQQSMWNKFGKTNTIPVNVLNSFFKDAKLHGDLEHMFKNMFAKKGGYALADDLWKFGNLFDVRYEPNNHANGKRIFVGEFEHDWVKDEYNDLFIRFIFECVFSHNMGGNTSPFDHHDSSYKTFSLNKFKTKWLTDFDVQEFAYVAALIIFILGEPRFRLYEAQQARRLYTPCNGSAFLKKDPKARKVAHRPVVQQNYTTAEEEEDVWEGVVETVEDVTPEPELIHYGWDDEEEAEEKVEPALEEKEEPALEEKEEPKPPKRKRKSKRLSKRERDAKKAAAQEAEDEKRWEEDAKKPDGWDLPDLPEGTVLPTW